MSKVRKSMRKVKNKIEENYLYRNDKIQIKKNIKESIN